ncbi:MAG: SRPBCC family protein [Candidatus Melainabacteria bacterium]
MRLNGLFRWENPLGRRHYLALGVLLVLVKVNLDSAIAGLVFHKPWALVTSFATLSSGNRVFSDFPFYGTMLLVALPFIWAGVTLTLRRLRSAGLPPGLVVLFFVPAVNYLFFLVLVALPEKNALAGEAGASVIPARWLPRSAPGSLFAGLLGTVIITALFGLPEVVRWLMAGDFRDILQIFRYYTLGLFMGLPFACGLMTVLFDTVHAHRSVLRCLGMSAACITLLFLLTLALAFEGLICLLMAFPLSLGLGMAGGLLGYFIQKRPPAMRTTDTPLVVGLLILAMPLLMGAEVATLPEAPLLAVTTQIDIDAPREVVWRHVVAFSDLPEPTEWYFRTGIAYPIRARINGQGVGAVRHCEFSTGPFVEPITVWDAPHLLRFSVSSQPMPMHELSWREIRPPHLDGYLKSEQGQFLLTPLPNDGTRLAGTTWYRHKMWPVGYWRLWSDGIIHRIHQRVLAHIKTLAEGDTLDNDST